jgi:hypothetical protein
LLGLHRGAGATRQNQAKQGYGNRFAEVIHCVTPLEIPGIHLSGGAYSNG